MNDAHVQVVPIDTRSSEDLKVHRKLHCIVLISSLNSSNEQEKNTRNVIAILNAKKIKQQYIDGAQEEFNTRRDELFQISGLRGQYPQVFLQHQDTQQIEFLGNYDTIQVR